MLGRVSVWRSEPSSMVKVLSALLRSTFNRNANASRRGVVESPAEVHLGAEQGQCAVVDLEFAHAARPPSFGSKEAGAVRACCLGLDGMKVQPYMRARRLTSKMRDRSATAGWTCREAVVCMVLPRSVVEE